MYHFQTDYVYLIHPDSQTPSLISSHHLFLHMFPPETPPSHLPNPPPKPPNINPPQHGRSNHTRPSQAPKHPPDRQRNHVLPATCKGGTLSITCSTKTAHPPRPNNMLPLQFLRSINTQNPPDQRHPAHPENHPINPTNHRNLAAATSSGLEVEQPPSQRRKRGRGIHEEEGG